MSGPGRCAGIAGVTSVILASCGTYVPQLNEPWEPAEIDDNIVYRIKKSIYCELRTAVHDLGPQPAIIRDKPSDLIPRDWGAQMTLKLTVDETGGLAPSASYTRTLRPESVPFAPGGSVAQSFSLPVSAKITSQAVRIDTYYSFFDLNELKKAWDSRETSCRRQIGPNLYSDLDRRGASYLLRGNLGIKTWLQNALDTTVRIPGAGIPGDQKSKLDVLQYNVRFVVTSDGSINPMWKLADMSTGLSGFPLLSANRTRTHDLLLTFGPAVASKASVSPSSQSDRLHAAGQLEQSLSSALRSTSPLFVP